MTKLVSICFLACTVMCIRSIARADETESVCESVKILTNPSSFVCTPGGDSGDSRQVFGSAKNGSPANEDGWYLSYQTEQTFDLQTFCEHKQSPATFPATSGCSVHLNYMHPDLGLVGFEDWFAFGDPMEGGVHGGMGGWRMVVTAVDCDCHYAINLP